MIILGFLVIVRTDTPKFLMQTSKEKAEQAIKTTYICDSQNEVAEIVEFMSKNNQKETSTVTIKEVFTDPEYSRGTWVNVFGVIFHELTGINVIFLYSHTILSDVLSPTSAFTA